MWKATLRGRDLEEEEDDDEDEDEEWRLGEKKEGEVSCLQCFGRGGEGRGVRL